MKTSSNWLVLLSSVLKGSTPEPGDPALVIPPLLQPIIMPCEPCLPNSPGGNDPSQTSCAFSFEIQQAISTGATTTTVCTLTKGHWVITYNVCMYSYSGLGTPKMGGRLVLAAPSPSI